MAPARPQPSPPGGPEVEDRTSSSPRLAYRVYGDQGPWVVLVMGLGMRGDAWRLQVAALRDRYRVVTFDHRGLGDSDVIGGRDLVFSMRDLAGDVLRILDTLSVKEAHLVGVSMGGMISQELALGGHLHLKSLTLVATHGGGPLALIPTRRGLVGFVNVRARDGRRRLEALKSMLYPDAYLASTDQAALDERMRKSFSVRPPLPVLQAQLRAVWGHGTLSRLGRLQVPTVVICPGEDQLVRPAACRRVAEAIPGARLVEMPEAGHGVLYQCADRVNALLLEHLGSNDG